MWCSLSRMRLSACLGTAAIWRRERGEGGVAGVHRVPVVGDEEEVGSKVQAAMMSSGSLLPRSECLPGALEVCRETQEEEEEEKEEEKEEFVMLLMMLVVVVEAQSGRRRRMRWGRRRRQWGRCRIGVETRGVETWLSLRLKKTHSTYTSW